MILASANRTQPLDPGWVRYLNQRLPGETPHADDDFFTTDSSADYTQLDVSGTGVWDIALGTLGCVYDDQTSGDVTAFFKPITSPSAPMTIETRATFFMAARDFPQFGIGFSNGITAGSTHYSVGANGNDAGLTAGNLLNTSSGTFTDFNSGISDAVISAQGHGLFQVYYRVVWKSANTFNVAVSLDGHSWYNNGNGNDTPTLTPTHIGFWASTHGNTVQQAVSFDYLRVYDADLSP